MTSSNIESRDSFLEYRKNQEKKILENKNRTSDPLESILTVEINATEMCNRKCLFCPRFDENVYPNRPLHLSVLDMEKIAEALKKIDYKNKISFSGFGENFLNKNFYGIIKITREILPNNLIECNTNGDVLNIDRTKKIFDSGLDCLYINMYDGPEQIKYFEKILSDAKIPKDKFKLRPHWPGLNEEHGLFLNNRSGQANWLKKENEKVKDLAGTPCHYPFYKMFVDWNGDVLFCSNDWAREKIVGNIIKESIRDVWMSKEMKKIRQRLIIGDRSNSPCNTCSVNGRLFAKSSFNLLKNYYENSDNGSH